MGVTSRQKGEAHFCNQSCFPVRELSDYTKDVETDWNLFKLALITSVAASCGYIRVGGKMSSEKKTALQNQEVKEAICAKKTAFKTWLTSKSSEQLRLRYSAARKTADNIVKPCQEKSWEELGKSLNIEYRSANKVFWQTIRCLGGKRTPVATFIVDTNGVFLKHQKGILNLWREYFCELLNIITVQHLETFEEQIGEEIYVTQWFSTWGSQQVFYK